MSSRAIPFLLLAAVVLTGCDEKGAKDTIVTQSVAYKHGEVELEGFLAYDSSREDKRPGVLVIHEWWGLGEHPKARAKKLAGLGYVAFCPDMYGKGKLTDEVPKAQAWSGEFYKDKHGLGRARVKAGYDVLAAHERVDASRIGAMGFCFGGTVALELAWSGADVKAIVSFHGSLTTPREEDVASIKSAVLVCHGADDGFVPDDKIAEFEAAMREAKLDWHLIKYGNSVHSFTNKGADAHGIPGVKYNAKADRRSWEHMKSFFAECLAP